MRKITKKMPQFTNKVVILYQISKHGLFISYKKANRKRTK